MIEYAKGNLLDDSSDALVNTVNEIGVMGKGIALMFREGFPDNTVAYERACKAKEIRVGHVFVTENRALTGPRWIINFPTKKHWRHPSRLEWIRSGLKDLVRVIREKDIQSVALPPLGCGNGGLEWVQVRQEIEAAMAEIPEVQIRVYAPTEKYQNAPKRSGVAELTPARAIVAELVRRYGILGVECTNLEVQKLAWFFYRAIVHFDLPDPLSLRFEANKYGPYSDQLRHLLDALDGSYLHCEKRLADASPFDVLWFEDSQREQVAEFLGSPEASHFVVAIERTSEIIDGFESPLGMELLATVDWLVNNGRAECTLESVKSGIASWPHGRAAARRKMRLFNDRLLGLAIDRLHQTMKMEP
jgi:O-acetyl-ADP-ribose deacetylase (regulator of RNase III)